MNGVFSLTMYSVANQHSKAHAKIYLIKKKPTWLPHDRNIKSTSKRSTYAHNLWNVTSLPRGTGVPLQWPIGQGSAPKGYLFHTSGVKKGVISWVAVFERVGKSVIYVFFIWLTSLLVMLDVLPGMVMQCSWVGMWKGYCTFPVKYGI